MRGGLVRRFGAGGGRRAGLRFIGKERRQVLHCTQEPPGGTLYWYVGSSERGGTS